MEAGEFPEQAAVREAQEETGLVVVSTDVLSERVQPTTAVRMLVYVACAVSGEAVVGDLADEFVWAPRADLPTLVPHGFFGPVQDCLDTVLTD